MPNYHCPTQCRHDNTVLPASMSYRLQYTLSNQYSPRAPATAGPPPRLAEAGAEPGAVEGVTSWC